MTTATFNLAERDIRQREIVPPEKLVTCSPIIIGVGAIGRQVAVQFVAVGVSRMLLIDFDTVGVENLAPQAYWPVDLGQPKVQATAGLCRQINPACEITPLNERFRRSMVKDLSALATGTIQPVIFACVDSIETRKLIWETLRGRCGLFVDGRMAAEVIRVLAADRPASDSYYATTLFAEAEAFAGSCTARSTVYTASIAAGLMLSAFTRWLRGLPVDRDISLNLLAGEMVAR
ncbi:MAG: ThiF family adenylyltransferase [Tepidisphaeraceae bacterium]|jgi:sulfur carrier protein ThiS adenylyltransferase